MSTRALQSTDRPHGVYPVQREVAWRRISAPAHSSEEAKMNIQFTSSVALLAVLTATIAGCDQESAVSQEGTAEALPEENAEATSASLPCEDPTISEAEADFSSVYDPFDPRNPDEATRSIADLVVEVRSQDGSTLSAEVASEAEEIRLRFAHALAQVEGAAELAARSSSEEQIEVTYLGREEVQPPRRDAGVELDEGDRDFELPEKYRDDATWLTGFSPATGSVFEVRIPEKFMAFVGAEGESRGANREPAPLLNREPEIHPRHQVGSEDTRVLKGALNTRQNSTNLSRIVSIGGCSGVLVGRHHTLTSAHCVYTSSGWNSATLRVGRNGTDWHGDAVHISGGADAGEQTHTDNDGNIYWISSKYKAALDGGGSTIAWDIALIITPNDHIGASTGWFGYAYGNSSHDDMYNRGYPSCTAPSPPPSCTPNHMFGDSNHCGTGGFSDEEDQYGFSYYGYHSCDASAGHSGSPLYRDDENLGWVVRGVHRGGHRFSDLSSVSNGTASLSFNLITRSRANLISWYKSAYS